MALKTSTPRFGLERSDLEDFPIPILISRKDFKGPIVFMNKALTGITGYNAKSPMTLMSWGKRSFPSPRYRKKIFAQWRSIGLARNKKNPHQHLVIIHTASGKNYHSLCYVLPKGNLMTLCFTEFNSDKFLLEGLQSVVETIPNPIALMEYIEGESNKDPRLIFINHAFKETFGYKDFTFSRFSMLLTQLYPNPHFRKEIYARWRNACLHANKRREIIPIRTNATTHSGKVLNILFHTRLMPEVGVKMLYLLDITPQKRLIDVLQGEKEDNERQREILRRRLRNSLTAASVAHEIDTSLGVILLQTKTAIRLAHKHPNDQTHIIGSLQAILNQAEGINLTIDRIRALIGNMDTRHEKVDLRGVVHSALLSLKDRLKGHKIDVEARYTKKMDIIIGDETQIYLIILNLLRNAIDSLCRKKRGNRAIRIKITPARNGVNIVVEDSGTNYKSKQSQRLSHWNARESGMGLGLFLIRSAVENHHGNITFSTSSLNGWKVSVWLPVTPPRSLQKILIP